MSRGQFVRGERTGSVSRAEDSLFRGERKEQRDALIYVRKAEHFTTQARVVCVCVPRKVTYVLRKGTNLPFSLPSSPPSQNLGYRRSLLLMIDFCYQRRYSCVQVNADCSLDPSPQAAGQTEGIQGA